MSSRKEEKAVSKLKFLMGEETTLHRNPRLLVVGVGGGGGNAVGRMVEAGIQGVAFAAVNTDVQALETCPAHFRVPIGMEITKGLGSGGNPELGAQAALADTNALLNLLNGADMVFLAVGLGGGTGSGAAPILASHAQRVGALTLAVATLPARMEGRRQTRNAMTALAALRENADTVIEVRNEDVFALDPELLFEEALQSADQQLRFAVQGITDTITRGGQINLDFQDVSRVLRSGRRSVMGIGEASGLNRAQAALHQAIHHPLQRGGGIRCAKAVMANFTHHPGAAIKVGEVNEMLATLQNEAEREIDIFFGVIEEAAMEEELRVTLVAALDEDLSQKDHRLASDVDRQASTPSLPLNPKAPLDPHLPLDPRLPMEAVGGAAAPVAPSSPGAQPKHRRRWTPFSK